MASVEDLYQEIILEHNKHPRNYGKLESATHSGDGDNPLCGDEVRIDLRIIDERVDEIKFSGQGCAISRAAASMLTEAIAGKGVDEAKVITKRILDALNGRGEELSLEQDGDLACLGGVRKFPSRLKCATLAWHALRAALEE